MNDLQYNTASVLEPTENKVDHILSTDKNNIVIEVRMIGIFDHDRKSIQNTF